MTPSELGKELTYLLHDLLADTGFRKKRKCSLFRKENECAQAFSFYFTRDRGLPGNTYSLSATLSFSFPEVDRLTSYFMGEEYDLKWPTGARPFYTVLPDTPVLKYKYCSDDSLERFADMVSQDFHSYTLPFYENYNTMDKLESHFEQYHDNISGKNGFSVVRRKGYWCCKAAVLCISEEWEKLKRYVDETDLLIPEQKEKIREYVSDR